MLRRSPVLHAELDDHKPVREDAAFHCYRPRFRKWGRDRDGRYGEFLSCAACISANQPSVLRTASLDKRKSFLVAGVFMHIFPFGSLGDLVRIAISVVNSFMKVCESVGPLALSRFYRRQLYQAFAISGCLSPSALISPCKASRYRRSASGYRFSAARMFARFAIANCVSG
jgi:hypothetical protein